MRGQGSFEFYADVASLPSGGRGTIQLLQIAVPTKELRYVEKAGSFVAEVRFSIRISAGDKILYKKIFQMKDSRDAMPRVKDLSSFLCHIDSCALDPGAYKLTVKVEDLSRRKKTLLGILRRTYLSSTVEDAAFEVRPFPANGIALADPILVWESDRSGRFIPNPMQIYGLRKDTLSVFVQASVPETSSADSLDVRLALTRSTGEAMEEALFKVPVKGDRSAFLRTVDLTTYSAGAYRLTVEAWASGGLFASSGKDFNVAWELVNWQKPSRDIMLEARILLGDSEFDDFARMSLGEQEAFMRNFWRKLDPTPQTAVNEVFERFTSRVRYADAHFGSFDRGALTDRGFTYVRFGSPDEIINQPMPQGRGDLFEGIEKVATEYKIITEGIMTGKSMKDQRPVIISPERQRATRGTVGNDVGSFEVWNYSFKGDPLLPDDKGMTTKQGLRFLFLDKDGIGDYHLVGSSENISEGERK
ncbi:MAG: GWxTD domain-containing protein [Candidatus Krumholzibacteria bacterium]|nr:GWxTD domain-containing protein [Candidatus Krumholzibacteria bacterium]